MKDLDSLKVAIVCDWLTGVGGAERVVFEMHKMFPFAPIYTSQFDPVAMPWFNEAKVKTLWLQKLPKSFKKFMPPLRAWGFSSLDLSAYDLVLSSSGAEAKGIKVKPGAVHITYCHAPTHYYWSRYNDYLANPGVGRFDHLARLGLKMLIEPMRKWDYKAAQRANAVITNSSFTQAEVNKYYGRFSTVIHPPVDVDRFAVPTNYVPQPRSGFVITGRQTPYKRVDLAVEACTQLNVPLTVIGNGPDHQKLVAMAGPSIKFLTNLTDLEMPNYLRSALAFIFPSVDDFGISAVEAMAAGTPVIAFKSGGALDYVVDGENGVFFEQQTLNSLIHTLNTFNPQLLSSEKAIMRAQEFAPEVFRSKLMAFIQDKI